MRILHWKTLFGQRLARQSVAPWLLGAVILLCVTLSLLGITVDLSLDQAAWVEHLAGAVGASLLATQALIHGLLEWTTAVVLLVIAFFALARCRTDSPPEAVILAAGLPFAAILTLVHLASWIGPPDDQLRLWTWMVARTATGLLLLVGGGLAVRAGGLRWRRQIAWSCLGIGATAIVASQLDPGWLPELLRDGAVLARPWDLLPLLLFLATGLFVFPQLHRQSPSVLTHALMLSQVPQIFAQMEAAFGSRVPEDGHSMIAHADVLLAGLTVLSGVVFDYVHTQRSHADALHGFESAQLELRSKAKELVRADRELVDTDIMRRRAERSLKILEKAVETMSVGVTVADLYGRILYVNPADARMHGYTVEELLGRSSSLYSPPGARAAETSDSIFLQPWARERANISREGRIFPVRLVSDMVRDDQGEPIALVTLCEDISERKRIEEALERRDRILEAVGLAAERFLADASWEESVEEVLENLEKATGVDRVHLAKVEDLKPHELDDTWIYDNARDTAPISVELPAGRIPRRWEDRLRRGRLIQGRVDDLPEDERRDLEARGVRSVAVVPIFVLSDWLGYLCLEDRRGDRRKWSSAELEALRTAARTFGAAMHRKRAEGALAASQAKYQDLLESANDLVQSVSPQGRFQFVNRAWKDALGYTQEEVGRLILWDVVHPDYQNLYNEVLRRILAGGPSERMEVVFVTRDGREIFLEGSLNARFVGGEPVATRAIFRDITERKIIDRMKTEFISTVSHELRTPLTSIIASLGLLQSGRLASDTDRIVELVDVAHRNSQRLLQLINDLLDLQKLAAGKIVYRPTTVDVGALVEEAQRGIQAFADSLDIRLFRHDVPEELRVMADRDRLIQVLNNLLSNAIKFSPRGETVTLAARRNAVGVEISVTDRGPGIPEEFRARLFERFTQGDSSATRSAGGSGLGLSIVKGLVEGMGGEIRVETEMGAGTTFHVVLPADPS